MDKATGQRSTMIGNQPQRVSCAALAGAVALLGLWLLSADSDALGGGTQEPKSRVPPGIATRLSPASRARLNLKARSAEDTAKSAGGAAAGAGRPRWLPSDDWTFRPTVLVRRGRFQGSGTIIASVEGETLVLTAAHVVQGRDPIVVELHRFNLGVERKLQADGTWPRRIRSSLAASDLAADLAVIRIEGMRALPFVARLARDEKGPPPDSPVTSIGIDLGIELAGWNSGIVDTLTFELNDSRERRPFLITENVPEHGRSGGGLFLPSGELVGVCVGHAELVVGRRMGVFASRKSIRFLLEDHRLTAAIRRSETRQARLSGRSTKRIETAPEPASSVVTPTRSVEKDSPARAGPR
jgi:S1-C subfamily serine protease